MIENLNLVAGENITLEQDGSDLIVSSSASGTTVHDTYSASTTDSYSCNYVNTKVDDLDDKIDNYVDGTNAMGSIVVDDINCKNICDIATVQIGKQWNGGSDANTATVFVPVLPSTQYTISYENNPFADNYLIEKNGADDTTAVVSAVAITSPTTRTTNANTHYLAISFYKPSGAITQSDFDNFKIQVELDDTNTNIVPYKKIIKEENGYVKESTTFYANDFKCRNLFNKNNVNKLNAYFNESTPTITSNSSNRTLYIPCKSNTTYTITIPDGTGAYAIGYTSTLPALNTSVSGVSNTSKTITTDANAKYLVMRYFQTAQATITEQQALDGIQIEIGSEATPYTPYKAFENEEIYSTNEMVIGRWIDGKPLYRKVIEISITTAGDYTYNVANLNIDTTVFFNGYCYVENQTTTKRPLPYITWNNNVNKTLVCSIESFDNNNIYCKSNWNNSKIFLSLEYTKTTD